MRADPPGAAATEVREVLAFELEHYCAAGPQEEDFRRRILALVRGETGWWRRDTLPGHLTASAFVLSLEFDRVLLHHHRKLDRWLQLGGHVENGQHPALAALREVHEESGLKELDFFGEPVVFDLDVHAIPPRAGEAGHDHLDVRFLMVADAALPLRLAQRESKDLRWWPLEELEVLLGGESGARRVAHKIRVLKKPGADGQEEGAELE